jgi:predicted phosphodiesterase
MNNTMNITRRSFFQQSAVGLTIASAYPACLADESRSLETLNFIVLSDTHVGYKFKDSAAKQWHKTAEHIAKSKGDFILHLGDVVDRRQEDQYAVYLKSREKISAPVHEIPGNHDPVDLFEKHLKTKTDRVVDHKWLRVILLSNAHTDSHDGFLTTKQLDWLAEQCAAAKRDDRYVIIAMHVTAHANKHPDRGWYVKPKDGQTKFYELLKEHKSRILATFHGHFHNGVRGWNDNSGIHELCFPSSLYNLNRGLKEKGAPGFNVLEFQPSFTKVRLNKDGFRFEIQPVGQPDDKLVLHECRTS